MADTSRKKTKTGKKNAPARAGSSADRSAQRGAELAVLRHVIAKGYVSRQTVRDVQGRLKRDASGESATLLGLLRGHVSDAAFEELTVIYRSAGDSSPASRTPKTSASNAPPDIVASLPEMAGMARLLALLSRRSVRIAAGVDQPG